MSGGAFGQLAGVAVQAEAQASDTPGGGTISISNPAASNWTMMSDIIGWVQAKKDREEKKRQFDRTFAENQRQFGLEYALKEFSTRKQLDLQEVRDMYSNAVSQGQLDLQRAATRQSLSTAAQEEAQAEEQFSWARQDREAQKASAEAFSRGLVKGFMGV